MGEPAAVGKGSGLKIQEYTHHSRPPSPAGADQGNCLRSGLTFRKGSITYRACFSSTLGTTKSLSSGTQACIDTPPFRGLASVEQPQIHPLLPNG